MALAVSALALLPTIPSLLLQQSVQIDVLLHGGMDVIRDAIHIGID
jgi:hypothetical protein